MQTRRSFLTLSTAAVTVSLLPTRAHGQPSVADVFSRATLGAYDQNLLSMAGMQTLVGSLFMVILDDGSAAYLRLSEVTDLAGLWPVTPAKTTPSAGKTGGKFTAVSINNQVAAPIRAKGYLATFRGDADKVPQGTYVVDHGRLGRFAMFLVPSRDLAGQTILAATFTTL